MDWLVACTYSLYITAELLTPSLLRMSGDPPRIFADLQTEGQYLDLEQLGKVLLFLSKG